ncbi:MAG TPA: 3-ketoacyl-ACP reductase FabG2 [Methylotenera sp.]|nr:3-ketoacyl-ACP reductase FabG2 [Methylotenera sp.]
MNPKRVLITGSSRGIGRAIALRLSKDGFTVTIHCRSGLAEANALATEITQNGSVAHVLQFDVCDREMSRTVLEADIAEHGAYYGIVCNAGISRDAAFPALSDEDWDSVLNTSLNGFFNVVHPLTMPMIRMKNGGRIVTLASVSGVMGNRGQVNYSAAKAGLIGATKALAVELAGRRITVNCVAPGLIATDMTEELETINEALKIIPMNRVGETAEVAAAVAFLMSDEASYITRQVLGVNGGMI